MLTARQVLEHIKSVCVYCLYMIYCSCKKSVPHVNTNDANLMCALRLEEITTVITHMARTVLFRYIMKLSVVDGARIVQLRILTASESWRTAVTADRPLQ